METKLFEIRDAATFMQALAVRLMPGDEQEKFLLSCAGFGPSPVEQGQYVLLVDIGGGRCKSACDPFEWTGARTLRVAHKHIEQHFDTLQSGEVVDVEFILGESQCPKDSESVARLF